jgi:RNA polymerase sigma-70 factor (ECF subfamily)
MQSRSIGAHAVPATEQIAIDELVESAVECAVAGDPEAFASIYRAFAQRIYRFCLFRVGRPADAEDLTQVIFLKIIEALPRYQRRGLPFSAWVFRVARNAVTDFERARRADVDLDALAERADLNQGDAILRAFDERDVLVRALNGLTRDQREVIAYRFFAGLTTREIGELVGRREGAIRALQCRALDALRGRLGASEP